MLDLSKLMDGYCAKCSKLGKDAGNGRRIYPSRRRLAAQIGVSEATLRRFESGFDVSLTTANKISAWVRGKK